MTIKQFTTAAKAESDIDTVGEDQTIQVDGRKVTFYAPTSGQLGVAMATAAGYHGSAEGSAAAINFFFSLLDEKDVNYFKRRLFDRKDPFGIDEIGALSKDLMEEWAGTPTKQPSDFAPSQSSTGQRSTAKRPKRARHHSR